MRGSESWDDLQTQLASLQRKLEAVEDAKNEQFQKHSQEMKLADLTFAEAERSRKVDFDRLEAELLNVISESEDTASTLRSLVDMESEVAREAKLKLVVVERERVEETARYESALEQMSSEVNSTRQELKDIQEKFERALTELSVISAEREFMKHTQGCLKTKIDGTGSKYKTKPRSSFTRTKKRRFRGRSYQLCAFTRWTWVSASRRSNCRRNSQPIICKAFHVSTSELQPKNNVEHIVEADSLLSVSPTLLTTLASPSRCVGLRTPHQSPSKSIDLEVAYPSKRLSFSPASQSTPSICNRMTLSPPYHCNSENSAITRLFADEIDFCKVLPM